MVMRATPEQHQRQIRALLNRPDVRPLLPTIKGPVLVMVGRQGRWSPAFEDHPVVHDVGAVSNAQGFTHVMVGNKETDAAISEVKNALGRRSA